MRRPIIVILLLLASFTMPAAWATDRGALFKVSAGGHSMLLFGTMHVGKAEFYPLEPRLAQAVAAAPVLALEIDPTQDPAVVAAVMQRHGVYGSGAARPVLPAALQARLARALAQAGIPAAMVADMKPWLVATVLGLAEYNALGYSTALAVDMQLAQMARAAKVPLLELESVEGQLALFNGLSSADQLTFLDEGLTLAETGKERDEALRVVTAWGSADVAALDAIAVDVAADRTLSGRFMQDVLLAGRNGALADKLAALLARQDRAVAAIGVLHLVGAHSVPALLRARGLAVERIY
jgi:uncharacterized protein YbaP (TraB family)